ncbi:MAG: hypothetical protein WAM60_03895 [Candidatus Promineifilaceae bacterium]
MDELDKLVQLAHSYIGKSIKVDESISRSREIGQHNRHFATHTYFSFTVEDVFVAFSGAQLMLLGTNARYGISLDSIVSFKDENGLEIVEHFEQKTERRTRITAD